MRRGIHQPLVLHENRFFDSDPSVRFISAPREETRDMPLGGEPE